MNPLLPGVLKCSLQEHLRTQADYQEVVFKHYTFFEELLPGPFEIPEEKNGKKGKGVAERFWFKCSFIIHIYGVDRHFLKLCSSFIWQ